MRTRIKRTTESRRLAEVHSFVCMACTESFKFDGKTPNFCPLCGAEIDEIVESFEAEDDVEIFDRDRDLDTPEDTPSLEDRYPNEEFTERGFDLRDLPRYGGGRFMRRPAVIEDKCGSCGYEEGRSARDYMDHVEHC